MDVHHHPHAEKKNFKAIFFFGIHYDFSCNVGLYSREYPGKYYRASTCKNICGINDPGFKKQIQQ